MAYSLKVFTSHYSIFTNFKPDHLNWHKDLQDYFVAKMHVFSRTKNVAVINQQVIDFAYENHLTFEQKDNMRIFEKFEKD